MKGGLSKNRQNKTKKPKTEQKPKNPEKTTTKFPKKTETHEQ